jgi:hypothetical protein
MQKCGHCSHVNFPLPWLCGDVPRLKLPHPQPSLFQHTAIDDGVLGQPGVGVGLVHPVNIVQRLKRNP